MAVRVENVPKKNFGQPHFTFSFASEWSSNEEQPSQNLPKSLSFKVVSPSQSYNEAKHLGLQFTDQESSSTLSFGQSHDEICAVGGVNSQDHCNSSESGQDESSAKSMDRKMKPFFLLSSSDTASNHSQADSGQSMAAHAPYHCIDPYFTGLFTPYGPHSMLGSQMVGMAAARVPLPLELADGGPIFVNAKQYHGILRRRQTRAKLEAQNKLLKIRKPYLHESRHRHAINRVRGSGGRFLGIKKPDETDSIPTSSSHSIPDTMSSNWKNNAAKLKSSHAGTSHSSASNTTCSDISNVSNSDVLSGQPDHGFRNSSLRISGGALHSGGLMCG